MNEQDAIFDEAAAALEAEAPGFGLRRGGQTAIPWQLLIDLAAALIKGCSSPTPAQAANPGLFLRLRARSKARQLAPDASPKEIAAMVDTVLSAAAKAPQEKLEAFQAAAMAL